MEDFWYQISHLGKPTALQIIDLTVVAYLVYRLLLMVRGSRAWRIIGGIVIYLVLWFASDLLGLRTIHFILDRALILGPVALVILLLPELRSALEGFGKLGFWPERLGGGEEHVGAKTVEEIVEAVAELSASATGALIVVERSRKMPEVESNGVQLNAEVTAALLGSIFYGAGPLHDGAVMVRGNSVVAAACQLPLTDGPLKPHMHMRHRAAVGATDGTDAVSIVVSEERGIISVALDGRIREDLSPAKLRDLLNSLLRAEIKPSPLSRMNKKKVQEDERASVG
ncbi:MAG: diadenylate cyclase CdaA [Fimbriimonadales bacterium]